MQAPAQVQMKGGTERKKRPSAAKTKYSFIKVMKRSLKSLQKNSYSNVGTGAKLSGNSLGFISTDNSYRTKLFKIVYSQPTEYILAFTICTHLVVLTLLASEASGGDALLWFHCDECGDSFRTLRALNDHRARFHGYRHMCRHFAFGREP